ncbi:MDR family NADP-dependent oxidoreductase [Allorhizocola rhizosphaerae]|uniref:MDR family NADP-dependent oxidoreductase n=1 Tax=Allorhizocola rhizosphaerae TaxID=1872709 RepID=UPI000E3C1A5C|nr:NADP-dependent oxidoreductase [Allorhizocola rhizosphaerae]
MTSETLPTTSTEVCFAGYPKDVVRPEHFTVRQTLVDEPGPGQVLVRNDFMTLAAAYRDQMTPATNIPIPVFQLGQPMWGRTVGTVVRSNSPNLAVGDLVEHFHGWREYAVGSAAEFHKRDRALLPGAEYYLTQGPTAWRGMVEMANVGDGDVVFVSGATSGVGSLAGQIAKLLGAKRVIGSTGSKSKAEYLLRECGFDAVFDYHDGPVVDRLRELAPDGINVFFDNVGGEQFEAAVAAAAPFARFALCGSLSGQLETGGSGGHPRLDLMTAIPKQLILRPFATYHTPEQIDGWNKQFSIWLRDGRIAFPHTIVPGGVADLPANFLALLERRFTGNVIAKLS